MTTTTMITYWIVICFLSAGVSGEATGADSGGWHQSIYKDLYEYVINASSPYVIPKKTLPIGAAIQTGVVAIHGVDRERNEIDVTRWFSFTWITDLKWDPKDYNGLKNISVPIQNIWYPDFHLYNTVSKVQFTREPSDVLFFNGMQAMFASSRSKIHCDDLAKDSCSFLIGSWGNNNGIIRLTSPSKYMFNMNKMLANEEFKESRYKVVKYWYRKRTVKIADTPDKLDVIVFTFNFKETSLSSHNGPMRAVFQWR